VRPGLLDLLFLIVLALSVVALIAAVGALLVSTFLVVPAATARLFVGRVLPLMFVSSALALSLAVVGLLVSYWVDAPPGATIAALAAIIFTASFAAVQLRSHRHGRPVLAATTLAIAGSRAGGGAKAPRGEAPKRRQHDAGGDWVRRSGAKVAGT
jgi:phosphate/sulfate permease